MDENDAIYALKKVKKVLDENNVDFWLDCGTLLGAVRDNKLLEWDDDIDLGTWLEYYPLIFEALRKLPNEFDHNRIDNTLTIKDKWKKVLLFKINSAIKIHYKNIKIDLILYKKKNDFVEKKIKKYGHLNKNLRWEIKKVSFERKSKKLKPFLPFHLLPNSLKSKIIEILIIIYDKVGHLKYKVLIPSHFFMNLSTIEFYDMKFKIPSNVEKYLESRYGKDWKKPNKDYIYYKDNQLIVKDTE